MVTDCDPYTMSCKLASSPGHSHVSMLHADVEKKLGEPGDEAITSLI